MVSVASAASEVEPHAGTGANRRRLLRRPPPPVETPSSHVTLSEAAPAAPRSRKARRDFTTRFAPRSALIGNLGYKIDRTYHGLLCRRGKSNFDETFFFEELHNAPADAEGP